MTIVWISHTVPVWNRWWTYLPISAKQGPWFLQTSRRWWFECPCHPFSWCSSGCWVCFHSSLPISPRYKLGVMFCVCAEFLKISYDGKLMLVNEILKKELMANVNQEGEYSFNAIKAFWLYDKLFSGFFFLLRFFFFITQYDCLFSSSDVTTNGKYFNILLPLSVPFFRDCERCRTILNTVIF